MNRTPLRRWDFWLYALLALLAISLAIYLLQPTAEMRVERFVQDLAKGVQGRSLNVVRASLHPDYSDEFAGSQEAAISKLVALYESLDGFSLEVEVDAVQLDPEGDTATVDVTARTWGFVGGQQFQGLFSEESGVDLLTLRLEKYQGDWRLKATELRGPTEP